MELIRSTVNIDFLKRQGLFMGISAAVIMVGIISLVLRGGPRYGIDFAGGLLVELRFEKATASGAVQDALKEKGFPSAIVQNAWELGKEQGREYIVRLDLGEGDPDALAKEVRDAVAAKFGADSVQIRRVEMVGPKVGRELREKGTWAMIFALLAIMIYLAWRFEFKYSLGAIVALVHDVLVTLTAFSVTNTEVDLPTVAAFLTIIGYSVNDTIVIFDRVRENLRKYRRQPLPKVINQSVNETLSRTILTSGTVFVTDLALFMFGGGVIHDFAFALLVGIVAGTYSTVFIASPVAIFWHERFSSKRRILEKAA